jgi:hypothetical protein
MTANAIAVTSTAKVANLNADKVDGGDWDAPGALGAVTPAAATVTTLTANSDVTKKDERHSAERERCSVGTRPNLGRNNPLARVGNY